MVIDGGNRGDAPKLREFLEPLGNRIHAWFLSHEWFHQFETGFLHGTVKSTHTFKMSGRFGFMFRHPLLIRQGGVYDINFHAPRFLQDGCQSVHVIRMGVGQEPGMDSVTQWLEKFP